MHANIMAWMKWNLLMLKPFNNQLILNSHRELETLLHTTTHPLHCYRFYIYATTLTALAVIQNNMFGCRRSL